MNEDTIPQYEVVRQDYSSDEKVLLGEIRENLVDLAISSGNNYQVSEETSKIGRASCRERV